MADLHLGFDTEEQVIHFAEVLRPKLSCGGCTACCLVVGVEELGKPYNCKCEHQISNVGCSIHDRSPDSCKGFSCFWKISMYGDLPELRPDRLGVLLCLSAMEEGMALDIYFMRSDVDAKLLAKLVAVTLAELPFFACIRKYPVGAKVGVEYPILPPYPPSSGTSGNQFQIDNTAKDPRFMRTWIKAVPIGEMP